MHEIIIVQGRELRPDHLEFIRQLLSDNPSWSRRRLSLEVCKAWDWRNAKGNLKDMASRSMLLKLDTRGEIQLPPRRQSPSNRMAQRSIAWVDHDTTPITTALKSLQPLRVVVVSGNSEQEALFSCLLSTHHYLGYVSSVGENMKYLVLDRHDRAIACLLFGSSAWSAKGRDAFIGWDQQTRRRNLNYTTNNTRFLILPWVRVPHLASHLLGLIARRIRCDWQARYGHGIELLETFVEKDRFQGTCYKAANWVYAGDTQGRSRNDRLKQLSVPIKATWVYPLSGDFRNRLAR